MMDLLGSSVKIRIDGDASRFQKVLSNVGSMAKTAIRGIATVSAVVGAATTAAGIASVKYNANIEQLQTSFEVMTGSAEKAAEVVERLRVMGAETPFETADLVETTQLLMQYGFTADEAIDRMSMLGDISQGNATAMNSIALAYAQMSSAGKVNLVDIKQMITAGFNPLQEISDRTGESMASLYDRISKGTMSVDEITQSMVAATSEGGKFFQSMEKQSRTLNGQLATTKDNLQSLGGSLFEPVSDSLRDVALPEVNALLGEMQSAFDAGGFEGMIASLNKQIPRLIAAGGKAAESMFSSLQKKIPSLMNSLFSRIPDMISGAVDLAPRMADVLFSLFNSAIEQTAEMLPELAVRLAEGLLPLAESALKGAMGAVRALWNGLLKAGLADNGAQDLWDSLTDEETVAEYKAKVRGDVDISEAESAIQTAYSDLTDALNSDLLSDEQVTQITDLIGTDYDTIYAKLKSFGLSDGDAAALADQVSGASDTLIAELSKLNIGVDPATAAKWIAQAEGSAIRLKSAMKRAGLSDEEIAEVVGAYETMTAGITGQMPNVIQDIYDALTDGKIETDDEQSLKAKLDEAYGTDLAEVDEWLKTKIGELDASSASYAADVAALEEEAAGYKAELATLHSEMAALVTSLVGQPTAVVEARMAEFANIEARIAAINAQIDETTAKADSAYAKAFERVRAGATTADTDVQDALSYAYTKYRLDAQAIEDAAAAAKTEADAAWEAGLKTDADDAAHMDALNAIAAQREADIASLEQSYTGQINSLVQGLISAFEYTSPETIPALESLSDALNLQAVVDQAVSDMTSEDFEVGGAARETIAQLYSDFFGQPVDAAAIETGEAATSIRTAIDQLMQNALSNLPTEAEGDVMTNPLVTALQGMFSTDALAGFEIDTSNLSSVLGAAFQGVGSDAAAGIGIGEQTYSFAGDTNVMANNNLNAANASYGRHSPATKFIPVGSDVAAGVGQGMQQYSFAGDAAVMASNTQNAANTAMSNAGKAPGRMFSAGIAAGILAGRSGVVSAARAVALAAVASIRSTLQIRSPSRVAMELGGYFGEGFRIGTVDSMNQAIRSVEQVVSSINLKPRLAAADLSSAFSGAAQVIADGEAERPIYLNVNGRTLGQVMASDNQRAMNIYNKSIAMGVGK